MTKNKYGSINLIAARQGMNDKQIAQLLNHAYLSYLCLTEITKAAKASHIELMQGISRFVDVAHRRGRVAVDNAKSVIDAALKSADDAMERAKSGGTVSLFKDESKALSKIIRLFDTLICQIPEAECRDINNQVGRECGIAEDKQEEITYTGKQSLQIALVSIIETYSEKGVSESTLIKKLNALGNKPSKHQINEAINGLLNNKLIRSESVQVGMAAPKNRYFFNVPKLLKE